MSGQSHSFEQLQRWMQSVIMHPGGVEPGIAADEAKRHLPIDVGQLDAVILPSQSLSAAERLGIYAKAYFARLIECLRAEFPMLLRATGEELFDQFAVDYLLRYPSTSHTLSELGNKFPQFLRETRPQEDGDAAWPDFLIDLAELERLYSEIFDGPGIEDLPPVDPKSLQQLSPDDWQRARLTPAPCLRLGSFDYPVNRYYRRLKKSKDANPPRRCPTYLAVTRSDYVVRPLDLGPAEYDLLSSLVVGECLGPAIETLSQRSPDFQTLADKLGNWFNRWMSERFFTAIEIQPM